MFAQGRNVGCVAVFNLINRLAEDVSRLASQVSDLNNQLKDFLSAFDSNSHPMSDKIKFKSDMWVSKPHKPCNLSGCLICHVPQL